MLKPNYHISYVRRVHIQNQTPSYAYPTLDMYYPKWIIDRKIIMRKLLTYIYIYNYSSGNYSNCYDMGDS